MRFIPWIRENIAWNICFLSLVVSASGMRTTDYGLLWPAAWVPAGTPPRVGMWAVLHEVRSEYAQALVVAFLLINGPGRWSLDALLGRTKESGRAFGRASARQQTTNAALI